MMKIQNTKRPTFHRISNSDENSDDSSGFRMDPTSNIHLVKVESSSAPMSKNSSVVGNPNLLPLGEARIDFTWTVNGSLSKRSVVQIKIFPNFFRTTQARKNSRAEKTSRIFPAKSNRAGVVASRNYSRVPITRNVRNIRHGSPFAS